MSGIPPERLLLRRCRQAVLRPGVLRPKHSCRAGEGGAAPSKSGPNYGGWAARPASGHIKWQCLATLLSVGGEMRVSRCLVKIVWGGTFFCSLVFIAIFFFFNYTRITYKRIVS